MNTRYLINLFFKPYSYSLDSYSSTGVLKLCTSTFLMYFQFLVLYFGNQIWKFMYIYFGKFSGNFDIFVLWIFIYIIIVL